MADEGSDSERRADARRPIELKVEYKRLNTFFADYTKNISRGGTFIKTSRPLPVGTEFMFKLFVPGREAPLTIHGEVQRIVEPEGGVGGAGAGVEAEVPGTVGGGGAGDEAEAGMAIKFVYREGDPQAEISRAVEAMMTESLGPRLYARLMEQAQRRRG